MEDCIFCKIIKNEIPSEKFFEDDVAAVILDIHPVSKGHSLVLLKSHYRDLVSTPDKELAEVILRVKKIAAGIMKATGAAGFNLQVNNGEAAGQVVPHLHFHIIPRFERDGLTVHWPHSDSEPKTRAQIASEIKKFL